MVNSTASDRSKACPSTKKRKKSSVDPILIDRLVQIKRFASGDLTEARFSGAQVRVASGRFNGRSPSGEPALQPPVDSRAYSGLQPGRYLDLKGAVEIQIGRPAPKRGWAKSTCSTVDASSEGSIWSSPRQGANLKPLSADSYLPYLDTI